MPMTYFLTTFCCLIFASFGRSESPHELETPVLPARAPSLKDNVPKEEDRPKMPVTKARQKEGALGDETAPQPARHIKRSLKHTPKAATTKAGYVVKKSPPKPLAQTKGKRLLDKKEHIKKRPTQRIKKPLTEKQVQILETLVKKANKSPNLLEEDLLYLEQLQKKLRHDKETGIYLDDDQKKFVNRLLEDPDIQKKVKKKERTLLNRATKSQSFQGGTALAAGIAGTAASAVAIWGTVAAANADGG
ncbi:MAG: hypothetical protein V6Z78_00240 [Holosporaceae bacterium]